MDLKLYQYLGCVAIRSIGEKTIPRSVHQFWTDDADALSFAALSCKCTESTECSSDVATSTSFSGHCFRHEAIILHSWNSKKRPPLKLNTLQNLQMNLPAMLFYLLCPLVLMSSLTPKKFFEISMPSTPQFESLRKSWIWKYKTTMPATVARTARTDATWPGNAPFSWVCLIFRYTFQVLT